MFKIILVEPDIPQNTGNIARLASANNMKVILLGKLGFSLEDKYLKRAGLDYWDYITLKHIKDRDNFLYSLPADKIHLFSRFAKKTYWEMEVKAGDYLIFGSETKGLPEKFKKLHVDRMYKIPMKNKNIRSLNLATSVGIVLYHAIYLIEYKKEKEV